MFCSKICKILDLEKQECILSIRIWSVVVGCGMMAFAVFGCKRKRDCVYILTSLSIYLYSGSSSCQQLYGNHLINIQYTPLPTKLLLMLLLTRSSDVIHFLDFN